MTNKLTTRCEPALQVLPAICLALIACTACTAPEPAAETTTEAMQTLQLALPAGSDQAADGITADKLRGHVATLADDAMEGRGPASPGDEKARQYLVQQFESMGLEPGAGDGSWQQPVPMVSVESRVPEVWSFVGSEESLELRFWDDFIAGSGVQAGTSSIEAAELIFVGYGIQAPENDWDDFKNTDLDGKVLVMLNNDPDWDPELFAGDTRLYYGRWDYKYESAARQGAAGAIIIHTTPSAGYPWQVVQTSWSGPQFELPAGDEPRTQVKAWVTWESAERLAGLAGHDLDQLVESARDRDFTPLPLGITTDLELTNEVASVESANVAGLLPGGDPELAEQVVVYTAHHDHLGVGTPNEAGDSIYNGALDNASGVASVLAIARAFTELPAPPRRSVLFLLVAAEEQGLLGSEHYARNPTFPPGRIAANVNIDGANIWGRTKDVSFIGLGKSTLDEVVVAAAARQGRSVVGDQFPDRGFFYRSDQFNLAKIGVPAIYASSGTEFRDRPEGWGREAVEAWEAVHYHQPSDELTDEWDLEGMVEDTRMAFEAGLHLAEADKMPSWRTGDEFEAARLEALATLAE